MSLLPIFRQALKRIEVRLAFPKSRWGDFTEPRREGIITDFSFLLLKREAVYTRLAGVRRLNRP